MLRYISLFQAGSLLALAVLLLPIGGSSAEQEVVVGVAQENKGGGGHPEIAKLRKLLSAKVNLDKGIDANTPLKDALDHLADRYDLTIIIDTKAFDAIGVQKVEEQPVRLPKMVGVSLSTVLRLLLSQIRGDEFHGTYFIRPDYVEVSTTACTFSADRTIGPGRAWLPTVQTEFDRCPLEDALRLVADLAATNIALDSRVGQKGRAPVTVRFDEAVAVDTAVRLLADMADLRSVAIDNVLYVTTKENAEALEEEKRNKSKNPFERARN